MKICIYNNKGGVGKSTLSSSIAFRAIERKIPLTLVDNDHQSNSIKWLSRDTWNGEESYMVPDSKVLVTRNADEINNYRGNELLIVDAPPEYDYIQKFVGIDIWIVPIKGRFSLDGAANVVSGLRALGRGNERVVFVSNNTDLTSELGRKQIDEAKKMGTEIYRYVIGRHISFEKAEDMLCSVWEVPYAQRSGAVQALMLFTDWVLKGCPERATYGENIKETVSPQILSRVSRYGTY